MWNNTIITVSVHPASHMAWDWLHNAALVFSAWCDMSYSSLGRPIPVFIPLYTQLVWHIEQDNFCICGFGLAKGRI